MKTRREIEYGQAWIPQQQRLLRTPNGQPTQERWIVMACRDTSFDLCQYLWADSELSEVYVPFYRIPYSALWDTLDYLETGGRKVWLIGWRMRYALERADFLGALERGQVNLPIHKKGKNLGKHSGKLTISTRILEVDIECGKNRIKMLDWGNYHVLPDAYGLALDDVQLDDAETALRDYLSAATKAGIRVARTTAAQVGWAAARSFRLGCEVHVNLDPESRRLERRAYHGGRCEAFRVGPIPGTTHSLDVQSCYARICRDELLPCYLAEEYLRGLPTEKIDPSGEDHWIADLVIRTDSADYPLQWDTGPIYPIGQYRTALPWPELRHALLRGRVVRVLRAARYVAGPVLRPYAEWYLSEKIRPKTTWGGMGNDWLKAIFNCSLGYTAREKYEWYPWQAQVPYAYWTGITRSPVDGRTPVQAQKLDFEQRWLRVAGEPREAMPMLHATITSYARVRLLEIFLIAGRQNVLYCDTDGILCTAEGASRLPLHAEPPSCMTSYLVQRFPPDSALIRGQKSYQVGDHVICAGVPKTRESKTLAKTVLTVTTGRVDSEGRVHPFGFSCEDEGGESEKWRNVMQ